MSKRAPISAQPDDLSRFLCFLNHFDQGAPLYIAYLSFCSKLFGNLRFWRVVRRVVGALTEGIVLPGAGASEVACVAKLELEAQR